MTKATLRYGSGRTRELTVHAEFSDGSYWATTRHNADTGYALYADGTVHRERYSDGVCLWSESIDATWEPMTESEPPPLPSEFAVVFTDHSDVLSVVGGFDSEESARDWALNSDNCDATWSVKEVVSFASAKAGR